MINQIKKIVILVVWFYKISKEKKDKIRRKVNRDISINENDFNKLRTKIFKNKKKYDRKKNKKIGDDE